MSDEPDFRDIRVLNRLVVEQPIVEQRPLVESIKNRPVYYDWREDLRHNKKALCAPNTVGDATILPRTS